jgi:hypothetical protein
MAEMAPCEVTVMMTCTGMMHCAVMMMRTGRSRRRESGETHRTQNQRYEL